MSTIHVSDDSFESDVLKGDGAILVDFWAEWCGPCKMIAPALEEIAKEMDGRVTVAKMNIDENPLTPQKYGVRGIPTLMVFRTPRRSIIRKPDATTPTKAPKVLMEYARPTP